MPTSSRDDSKSLKKVYYAAPVEDYQKQLQWLLHATLVWFGLWTMQS